MSLIADSLKRRVRNDWDAVLAITGEEGVGKSTLGIQLGRQIDAEFSLEKNIIFDPENMVDKVRGNTRYSVNIVDEAARALYSRTWYERRQILINKYLKICRKENKILFLIIPDLWELDSSPRNKRVLLWIWVLERDKQTNTGKAAMFINERNQLYPDPWGLKEGQKIFTKVRGMNFLLNKELKYKMISKLPSFVCFFEFPKLEDDIYSKYRELADKANEELEARWDVDDKYKAAFTKICCYLNRYNRVSALDIAGMVEGLVSRETVNRLMRVERKIERDKIKKRYATIIEGE